MNFSVDSSYPFLLLVLWALGISMIALAALIHPSPWSMQGSAAMTVEL